MDVTLPRLLKRISSEYPNLPAQYFKDPSGEFESANFSQYWAFALNCAGGLLSLGHGRSDHVGLISDNRKEWPYASMGIMAIGAADVPRGCDATPKELSYILSFSECKTVFLDGFSQAQKIVSSRDSLPLLRTLIFFDIPDEAKLAEVRGAGFDALPFDGFLARGSSWRDAHPGTVEAEIDKGTGDEIATLIFTSGTTGEPKGVMVTHRNFLCQLEELPRRIVLKPGDRAICVLPVWHSFERLCEYVILNAATSVIYSKPVGSILLADIAKMNPTLMPSVPRIWESVYDGIYRQMRKTGGVTWALFNFFVDTAISQSRCGRRVFGREPTYRLSQRISGAILSVLPWLLLMPIKGLGVLLVFRKIRAKLGNSFYGGVSGGGALPPNIDEFFWAVGINVVEGYGLTETAPVVAVRPMDKPMFGTIGKPISCCEARIVDEFGAECPPGVKGTVLIRGENVMKGYYRKPDLTARVLSADGWLDTGDLGFKTRTGELVLRGRKKDTIVLRGGENIEPAPIEMKLNESRFISQSVVLGQDQRYLGALIVVNKDELSSWAKENAIEFSDASGLLKNDQVQKMYEAEVGDLVSGKNGFKMFERINRIALLSRPFETGRELSAKQEIMRYRLDDLYKEEIKRLFD
jgi:long-chain acyl-CoA synthetase